MPDRENAIKCLIDIEQIMITRQEICPPEELQYWIELQEGVADALSLLKEQEAVEPITVGNDYRQWRCPKCRDRLRYRLDKFCPHCGRVVKWE